MNWINKNKINWLQSGKTIPKKLSEELNPNEQHVSPEYPDRYLNLSKLTKMANAAMKPFTMPP